jgi:hypothetical protein
VAVEPSGQVMVLEPSSFSVTVHGVCAQPATAATETAAAAAPKVRAMLVMLFFIIGLPFILQFKIRFLCRQAEAETICADAVRPNDVHQNWGERKILGRYFSFQCAWELPSNCDERRKDLRSCGILSKLDGEYRPPRGCAAVLPCPNALAACGMRHCPRPKPLASRWSELPDGRFAWDMKRPLPDGRRQHDSSWSSSSSS